MNNNDGIGEQASRDRISPFRAAEIIAEKLRDATTSRAMELIMDRAAAGLLTTRAARFVINTKRGETVKSDCELPAGLWIRIRDNPTHAIWEAGDFCTYGYELGRAGRENVGFVSTEVTGVTFDGAEIEQLLATNEPRGKERLQGEAEVEAAAVPTTTPSKPEQAEAVPALDQVPRLKRRGMKSGPRKRHAELALVMIPIFRRKHDFLVDMSRRERMAQVHRLWTDPDVRKPSENTVESHWNAHLEERAKVARSESGQ